MVAFRRAIVIFVTGTMSYAGATVAQTPAGDPPSRVGRLAFLQGTVSFHDNEQTDWAPALVNTPVTSGDAVWTEPNARSEISIAGTRVRMDSASQLDMLALDDTQTRMQLDQGRIDIQTFTYDTRQPYEIVTPRGTISLQQQGDYYVEAGTTQDPTRLGVRKGAAQIQTPNGQVLAVRAGEVGEVSGDGSVPQLHTIQTAPPPMPASWAERDRQVVYDKPPQYLGSNVTGYEDLNYYGSWTNDPEYGQVWSARSVPAGWSPYTTGRWNYEQTYGWTWVDEQPWGFAPYHYGRWAQRNDRWFWVPPERQQRAVYAPALVAFVGGTELGALLGQQNRAPVGWFPLGPREAYVPPYTNNREYYRRLNMSARVQQQVMEDRWQRAQRREALADDRPQYALMNRRFATVMPAEDFARSRPVERTAIKVAADKLATAPVALLATPPSPTQSLRALHADNRNDGPNRISRPGDPRPGDTRPNDPDARRPAPGQPPADRRTNEPAGASRFANLQAIKPEPEREKAPGPKFTPRSSVASHAPEPAKPGEPAGKPGEAVKGLDPGKGPLPQLIPRNASAPPPARIEGERRPVSGPQANAPAESGRPTTPPRPGEANRPEPQRPDQATLPPVRDRNDRRPEPPRAGDADRKAPGRAETPRPADAQRKEPDRADAPKAGDGDRKTPDRAETPRPADAQRKEPDRADAPKAGDGDRKSPDRAETPRPGDAQRKGPDRAETPRAGDGDRKTPDRAEQPRAAQPQPPNAAEQRRPVDPPKPPQAQSVPQPAHPEAPKPPQAGARPAPPPAQAAPPASAPQKERETRAAPPAQPQPQQQPHRQAPPQQETRAPAPQQTHQAPAPQQAQRPTPQQQQPQQAQAPRPAPQPQQAQAPRPAPQQQQQQHSSPPQQAQAPRPSPPPQQQQAPRPQHNQQAQAPANEKNDKK